MRRGTTFRIVGTAGAEVEHIEKPTLALPLGELSPKVTERVLRRLLNNHVHLNPQRWPSQSRLCRASSPKGRAKGTLLRIRPLFLQYFTPPRGPHQARPGEPASPKGSSCTVSDGTPFESDAVLSGRSPGTAHRPFPTVSLVGVTFIHTSCNCNVAGGRLPMKSWCDCPGNHFILIRCA